MEDRRTFGSDSSRLRMTRFVWIMLLLVLLLGAVLRFYQLGTQSFWDDEIASIHVASYPLQKIWTEIARWDSNPMMFYTVFRPYLLRAPQTEQALRIFPLLLGLASLAVAFALFRRLAGVKTALIAAFLLAINPLAIYCSQEIRYNSLVLLAGLCSFYFFVRLLESGRLHQAIGYALATTVAVYTHYYAFFLVLLQLLYVVIALLEQVRSLRSDRQQITRLAFIALVTSSFFIQGYALALLALYFGAHKKQARTILLVLGSLVGVGVLYLPFLKTFGYQLLRGVPYRLPVPISEALEQIWIYATVGHSVTRLPVFGGLLEPLVGQPAHALALFGLLSPLALLIVIGFWGWPSRGKRLLAVLFLLAPVASAILLTMAFKAFDPRYFLPFVPAVVLLMGQGLANLGRKSRLALAAGLLYISVLSAGSLTDYYHNPDYYRQDWRGAVREIVESSEEGDAILFYDHFVAVQFLYYFDYEVPYYYLFSLHEDLQRSLPERRFALGRNMERFLGQYRRFWLFDYHGFVLDPQDEVRGFLRRGGYEAIKRECRYPGFRRWCVELYTNDIEQVQAQYDSQVDFAGGGIFRPQAREGWYASDEPGAWWMGKTAAVQVKVNDDGIVAADFLINYDFLGGEPFTVTLGIDGVEAARITVDRGGLFSLSAEYDHSIDESDIAEITLISEKTFIPAQVFGGRDRSEKSLLVYRIGFQDK